MSKSPNERAILEGLAPGFRPYVEALLELMRQVGWKPQLTSGRRSRRAQEALIRAGKTTATRSLHLAGIAVDIAGLTPAQQREAGELWESWGGRWGGRFRSKDPIHFDAGLDPG